MVKGTIPHRVEYRQAAHLRFQATEPVGAYIPESMSGADPGGGDRPLDGCCPKNPDARPIRSRFCHTPDPSSDGEGTPPSHTPRRLRRLNPCAYGARLRLAPSELDLGALVASAPGTSTHFLATPSGSIPGVCGTPYLPLPS